ncbi:hypothetical protein RISK_005643 [Rhodopirellula islandica]|uniref:Uncharacterized protein n=1 Tax=Rhodopirellula islandica TaxID=595434 RepID=A0A0J1B763_RHOIS|nr:hypothetical protein [Rhodopirellula islandica]KLU02577.1 hypothetical protein RISK_005643 [Rhodopirellula islandica]
MRHDQTVTSSRDTLVRDSLAASATGCSPIGARVRTDARVTSPDRVAAGQMAGRNRCKHIMGAMLLTLVCGAVSAQSPVDSSPRRFSLLPTSGPPRVGSTAHRQDILDALPMDRLTVEAKQRILGIAEKPTLFRRLPSQIIPCDRDMFLFLTRNPDVLVGLWDLMGITQVQSTRTGPYQLDASDGVGTLCRVDLVYGDANKHIFVVDGSYDGKMTPTEIRGKGVFVLESTYTVGEDGRTRVSGTLDCFVQLDSLGIDLIARTMSPIIGRSADSNFEQTAQFIAQVSEASERNPSAMLDIAARLPQVTQPIRDDFSKTILDVARRGQQVAAREREQSTE